MSACAPEFCVITRQLVAVLQVIVEGFVSVNCGVGVVPLVVEANTAVFSDRCAIFASDSAVATCSLSCSVTTNDVAGFPPSDSASAAFSAYGTLTRRTRGCS